MRYKPRIHTKIHFIKTSFLFFFHIYFEKDARIVVVIRSRYSVFDIVVVIGLKIVVQELYLFFYFFKSKVEATLF